jgi:two-component system, OmpR family, sensor kinase
LTLRTRLLLALVALTAVGLAIAGLITYRQQQTFLLQRVDEQLASAQQPMYRQIINEVGFGTTCTQGDRRGFGLQGLPYGAFGELLDTSGAVVNCPLQVRELTRAAPAPPNLPSVIAVSTTHYFGAHAPNGGTHYRVLAARINSGPGDVSGVLVVAFTLTDVDQTLHHLLFVELLVAAAVLFAIALMSWWVVRTELRPLQEMGSTAGAIAAGDLSRRVEPADEHSEVGRLGLALNSMLGQIEVAFAERTASEARLRRFVADAGHELRTPLTSIRGYAELFRRGANTRPDDLAKTMIRIEEAAARMGVLVEDLLLLARLDQGRPLEREAVDLSRLAGAAVDDVRAISPERTVTFTSTGPVVVTGDEFRLRQVVANLLENARTHTPANAPIEVRVSAVDAYALIEIQDQGPGMTSEEAAHAFERFWRADPSRARTSGGAGLGLSIVAAITQAHGGRAEVQTAPGAGATFRIWLPRSGPATNDPPPGASDQAVPDAHFETLPEVQPEV